MVMNLGKEILIYWALNYKLGTLRNANIIYTQILPPRNLMSTWQGKTVYVQKVSNDIKWHEECTDKTLAVLRKSHTLIMNMTS